ncbi:MAG: MlaD family protein, partial [Planctomycetota bacterium JB042]
MATKKEKVWAGLFLVGAVALMVGAVAFIQGLGRAEPVPFDIHFPPRSSVAGLAVGNKVRFKGVPIGKVGEIRLADEGYAVATIEIAPGEVRHLDAGVRAVLTFDGITGSKSIDLKQIDPAAAVDQALADERWAGRALLAEAGVLDTLLDEGPAVIDDVQGLLGQVGLLVR